MTRQPSWSAAMPKVRIVVCRTPLRGVLLAHAREFVDTLPESWRTHATTILSSNKLDATTTVVVLGLAEESLAACCWLSLPDLWIIPKPHGIAYLFHVWVRPDVRGRGLASHLCQVACNAGTRDGIERIRLSTSNEALKSRLYGPLGFGVFRGSSCLMEKRGESLDEVAPYPRPWESVRFVSPHDLATVQSICTVPHWSFSDEDLSLVDGDDYEEEFCSTLTDSLKDGRPGYLVVGEQHGVGFSAWFRAGTTGGTLLMETGDVGVAMAALTRARRATGVLGQSKPSGGSQTCAD